MTAAAEPPRRDLARPQVGRGEDHPAGADTHHPSSSRSERRPCDPAGHLRLVEGDVYADWESAYRDNVARVYRLMFSRVGNRADAEDLTADVFRAALGPLRLDCSKGEVRAYLLTTARTVLASHWRRRFGLEVTAINPDADIRYLSEPADHSDAPQRAAGILDALPDRYRRVLQLRFLEACSIKEVARAMDVSVSNAKVLQHRALRMAANIVEGMAQ
jgi:RNA polymerase sigma-70 factor (ECF subfamily)